jgi:hypothetical protein
VPTASLPGGVRPQRSNVRSCQIAKPICGAFKGGAPSDELVERPEEALIAARDHLIAGRVDEALAVIESALDDQRRRGLER